MGLSKQQRKQLQFALESAFPTKALLEQMLSHELDKNLEVIAGLGNLQEIIFKIIQTAEAQGWILDLIRAAQQSNPGNPKLKAIDFALVIKPIVDTLDLYHNSDVDPRAIAISFQQLAENYPDDELEIVAMEKRGQDKFLLRAKTAPTADKSELSAEYFTIYNELKALAKQELKALMEEKDSRISSLETMVKTALQSPKFYMENYHNQGDTTMGGDRNINMGSGNYNERIERDYVQGISQNMSGGTMHGGMQAAQGDRNQQTMTTHVTTSGQPPTQPEVIKMLAELEQMISDVELPLDIKEEVTMYLGAAKKAVKKEKPNKERVKANLEGVVEVLQDASQKSLVGKTVWEKTKPVLLKVTDWMGQAAAATLLAALL